MIQAMCVSLLSPSFDIDSTLMLAFMAFLPKKAYSLVNSIRVYHPRDTRPLSLSNTFIKLVCCVLKVLICNIVDSKIHHSQKCIAGRFLLENVVRLDAFMHMFAIDGSPFAAGLLFDQAAAFPSVAHKYIWAVLAKIGFPPLRGECDEEALSQ